ncbi:hypothetical protein [Streptomyces sp. NPDC006477]|uniref:hypothetical protein n=1 Tax=Streptomyces sp. NPDC006477 TaxID=3364747 RepID=UPI0036D1E597
MDGVNLSSLAYDITTRDGMDTVPAVVGSNVSASQAHGERWIKKFYAPARKQLIMWVSSRDKDTGVEGATLDIKRQNLDENIDYLMLLFGRRTRLLDVRRTLSNGTIRQASAEVVAQIDPLMVGLSHAKFSVELNIPSGFWRDVASSTMLTTAPGSNIVIAAGATAPMVDLEFRITGPATNPRVTDVESGSYFQYNGTVSAGNTLAVKNSTMTITGGTLSNMVHDGETNWVTLYPSINGTKLNFTASGTTGATELEVVGKKAYLR